MAEAEEREPLLTDDVRELLRLVGEGDISEVLIKRGNAKVHIKRNNVQPHVLPVATGAASPVAIPGATYLPQPVPAATGGAPVQEEAMAPATGVMVTAPMVGTFYASPSPKEPPYVRVGDEVRPGDVLGIIEAMKIMNEIECELHGRVTEVLVENGQAVEYGQPLLVIEPL